MPGSSHAAPPSADDDAAYVFIDHREDDTGIVSAIAAGLPAGDPLQMEEEGDDLFVRYQGRRHRIPLRFSPHDRYITVSSLAEVLGAHYNFYVLEPSLAADTHGLLVVPQARARSWPGLPDHLVPLEPGYDYFHDIRVPYLHHEDSAPNFAQDSERVAAGREAMGDFVQALLSGKMDDAAAASFARIVQTDPDGRAAAAGKSEAELAAEIQLALNEAWSSPSAAQSRRELEAGRAELRSLGARSKPWWKLW